MRHTLPPTPVSSKVAVCQHCAQSYIGPFYDKGYLNDYDIARHLSDLDILLSDFPGASGQSIVNLLPIERIHEVMARTAALRTPPRETGKHSCDGVAAAYWANPEAVFDDESVMAVLPRFACREAMWSNPSLPESLRRHLAEEFS